MNPVFGETESIDRKVEPVDNQSHQTTQVRQKSVHSQSPTGASSSETFSPGYIFEPKNVKKRNPIQAEQGKRFKKDIYENYRLLLKTVQIALTNTFNGSAYISTDNKDSKALELHPKYKTLQQMVVWFNSSVCRVPIKSVCAPIVQYSCFYSLFLCLQSVFVCS